MKRFGLRWPALLALASAGLLSGCYYDPYTGYSYPYGGYYPYGYYPYPWGYPYPPRPYPPPQGAPAPAPNAGQGTLPPTNAPVQQTPLPPPS